MLLTLLGLVGPLLTPLLSKFGVSPSIDSLATAALTGAKAIITSIQTKSSVTAELAVLQAALVALRADTSIDPAVLSDVSEGILDLEAGIAAYQAAELTTNPSTLTSLPSL